MGKISEWYLSFMCNGWNEIRESWHFALNKYRLEIQTFGTGIAIVFNAFEIELNLENGAWKIYSAISTHKYIKLFEKQSASASLQGFMKGIISRSMHV